MVKLTPRIVQFGVICAALGLIVGTFLVTETLARDRAKLETAKRGNVSAEILTTALERELEKFRLATLVLAQDADARAVLRGEDPVEFSKKLSALSSEMGAAAIYLLDSSGQTLAASNWQLPETFVGQNYGFRPYFREAMRLGQHEQFALGTVSRRPGLYIARRMQYNGKPIGVIVSKVEFDNLEAEWRKAGVTVFATNSKGVILVTSAPDWRFRTVQPLIPATQSKMLRDLDYGTAPLEVLKPYSDLQMGSTKNLTIASKTYSEATNKLLNGWQIHVLTEAQSSIESAVISSRIGVLAGLLALFALGLGMIYLRRNAAFKAERNLAMQLRETNERLVQLNKLATLGQIAAGVGHEINQPLAAITAYTRNAMTFLERGQIENAGENLTHISDLASRIGAITSELRSFARKATGAITPVRLSKVVEGALLLMRDPIATGQAHVQLPESDATVWAEAVRLEQVLVNLIQNALDAGQSGVKIELKIATMGSYIELSVIDDGPGFSQTMRASLFQPFSTSKLDGLGLGLVISRDIMADFGGELVAANPKVGAALIMRLRPAP